MQTICRVFISLALISVGVAAVVPLMAAGMLGTLFQQKGFTDAICRLVDWYRDLSDGVWA